MEKRNPFFAIMLVVICTFLTSFGQYFIKLGTAKISGNLISILSVPLIGGFLLYGIGAVILIIALKYGELSVLYPFIALSFVWVFLLSTFVLKEVILFVNWFGLIFIILGVSLIGWGGNHG
ncbi:EamA/RhaT family transporter [Candidatus Woesearchaeota archaeon]|nr:EamA/RhaT family transporter [Candidatus Woesearchaeota archaeon]